MNRDLIKIPFLTLILSSSATTAVADDENNFKLAYAAYQQHISANETELALVTARNAQKYGTKVFGKSHTNSANLALNYARLLNDTGDHKKARKILKGKLRILEEHYGDNSPQLVPMIMEEARAAKNPKTAQKLLTQAADLSRGYEDKLIEAQKNFDIVVLLLNWGGSAMVEPFVNRAYEIYVEKLQPNDFRLGLMAYHKAKWAISRSEHKNALKYLEQSLTAFRSPAGETIGNLERTIRPLLVQTHENLNQSDAATEHLLVLGAHQDWSEASEPVFKTEFSAELIEKKMTGEVTLRFTVDEQGFVKDPVIADSNQALLEEAALTMIKGFRYSPRFIDSKPVATEGIEYTASLNFEKIPSVPRRAALTRPPIRGMMNPDKFDTSECTGNGASLADSLQACDGFGSISFGK